MNLVFLSPTIVCFCVAIVLAVLRQWKNMIITILVGIIFFQFAGFVVQAHRIKDVRRWNEFLKTKVNDLEKKLDQKESNKSVKPTPTR